MKYMSSSPDSDNFRMFWCTTILLTAIFFSSTLLAEQHGISKPSKAEVIQKTQKLQIPFIANNGQTDERVKFYASTFGGSVFITKNGEIVYSIQPLSPIPLNQGWKIPVDSNACKEGINNYSPMQNFEYSGEPLCLPLYASPLIATLTESRVLNPLASLIQSSRLNQNVLVHTASQKQHVESRRIVLKEELIGGKINEIKGEGKAVTNVNYFKGNDPSEWKTNISTYDVVTLGEVYKGIDLKLKAYGNNVEKLFYIKPDTNPDQIKVKLSGAKSLRVNEEGQLEAETALGIVKFTKPMAYQEIDGKRVKVAVEYDIQGSGIRGQETVTSHPLPLASLSDSIFPNPQSEIRNPKSEYGFKVATYDKTKELVIDPLLASTFLGGSSNEECYSMAIDSDGNIYVTGFTESLDFPTTAGAYDTSHNFSLYSGYERDVFVSKLSEDLTSLLASTYLGGSYNENGNTIAIDSDGNIYVAGSTNSSDFPITTDAYDISGEVYYGDSFVSKLSGDLTSLLASTYLGGSYGESVRSIAIGLSGDIYVAGETKSSDFPTTLGAYNTFFIGGHENGFVSKINGELTSLLASTFLGGASYDYIDSIVIDTIGNIYVAGETYSSDFPTTPGAYDTSFNGSESDAFASKLNGELTNLIASTYLGGSGLYGDSCKSIDLDSGGNVYLTGETSSSDFPITIGAYDTSFNGGNQDGFISKLNGELTSLLASTYFGGSSTDYAKSIAISPNGNMYVACYTGDVFIFKLNGDLTSLLASVYFGGYGGDSVNSIAIGPSGDIYVAGLTESSNFPITSDAYDTSKSGQYDAFVSKFDSNLSYSPPEVTTGSATGITSNSATLNGTVNANGLSTSSWFEYGTTSGSYSNISSTQTVSGWNDTSVSINVSGLSTLTTYYCRIVAQNNSGTVYGNETSFATQGIPPKATTGSATNVTSNLATLNGIVNANGLATTAWFEYGTASGSYSSFSSTQTISGSIDTSVSINVSGLSALTTYYYRIVAKNSKGTTYGNEIFFTTQGIPPKVATKSATNITSNSATLNGTVNANGLTTTVWFEYGTTSGSYNNASATQRVSGSTETSVNIDISGLLAISTYYYRIVAQNSSGTVYGNEMSFTTQGIPPKVTTGTATKVTSDSATLNGIVNANGLATTSWFEYGTTSGSYGNASSLQIVIGSNDTTVTIKISGLSADTAYYYRVAAQNSAGTTYGSENNFKTTILPIPTPTPMASPTPTPLPSLTPISSPTSLPLPTPMPTPTVSPTVIPTPACKADSIMASPKTLKLKRKESTDVMITVPGNEGCLVVGDTVTATIKSGKKRISVSPASQETNVNGQAVFTIIAKDNTGNAKVIFKDGSLKTKVKVKVVN